MCEHGKEFKEVSEGNTCVFVSACDGDKLGAFCVRPLTCVCLDGVIGGGGGRDGASPCLHCAGDLSPLMAGSEGEEGDAERGRGRGFK